MDSQPYTIEADAEKVREVLSPEGVEERVVHEEGFRVTLTAGGKYRIYMLCDGDPKPMGIEEDLEAAKKHGAGPTMLRAMMTLDRKKGVETIVEMIKATGDPDAA